VSQAPKNIVCGGAVGVGPEKTGQRPLNFFLKIVILWAVTPWMLVDVFFFY
jgi:hypothetical protein